MRGTRRHLLFIGSAYHATNQLDQALHGSRNMPASSFLLQQAILCSRLTVEQRDGKSVLNFPDATRIRDRYKTD